MINLFEVIVMMFRIKIKITHIYIIMIYVARDLNTENSEFGDIIIYLCNRYVKKK